MKSPEELRAEARAALSGNWPKALVCTILMVLIVIAVNAFYVYRYISVDESMAASDPMGYVRLLGWPMLLYIVGGIFLLYPLQFGYYNAFRQLLKDGDADLTNNMFRNTFSRWGRNVWGYFLMSLFIALWALLLYIPGIIKAFAYSMTPYILKDYPELSANQAINLSIKMMKGHKFDLFYLFLTFTGWAILAVFTCGIGYLWLTPYMSTAMAAFYEDVKADYTARIN